MAKVHELMKIEKALLLLKHGKPLEMNLDELVKIDRHLANVGKITSKYFEICKMYDNTLSMVDDRDLHEKLLTKFSDRRLEDDVDFDVESVEQFIDGVIENHPEWLKTSQLEQST